MPATCSASAPAVKGANSTTWLTPQIHSSERLKKVPTCSAAGRDTWRQFYSRHLGGGRGGPFVACGLRFATRCVIPHKELDRCLLAAMRSSFVRAGASEPCT